MKYMSLRAVTQTALCAALIVGHTFGSINASPSEEAIQEAQTILYNCLMDRADKRTLSHFIDELIALIEKKHADFVEHLRITGVNNPEHYLKLLIEKLKSVRKTSCTQKNVLAALPELKPVATVFKDYKWLLRTDMREICEKNPIKVASYLIPRLIDNHK